MLPVKLSWNTNSKSILENVKVGNAACSLHYHRSSGNRRYEKGRSGGDGAELHDGSWSGRVGEREYVIGDLYEG